jgi:hypothetical protein
MVFTMYRHESRSGGREIRKVHEENLGAGDGLAVAGEQGAGRHGFLHLSISAAEIKVLRFLGGAITFLGG